MATTLKLQFLQQYVEHNPWIDRIYEFVRKKFIWISDNVFAFVYILIHTIFSGIDSIVDCNSCITLVL